MKHVSGHQRAPETMVRQTLPFIFDLVFQVSHNVGFFNAQLWRLPTGDPPDASVSG